jgi:hypothetical protein
MSVVVYGFPQSTYVRTARMCLEEKGVDYALEPVDLGSDDYRALHPFAKVPAFRHGDVHLYETVAIARYVDGAFDGPALAPADVAGAARMSQWISVVIDYVYPTVIGKVVLERFAPAIRGRDADEAVITEALPQVGPRRIDDAGRRRADDCRLFPRPDSVLCRDHARHGSPRRGPPQSSPLAHGNGRTGELPRHDPRTADRELSVASRRLDSGRPVRLFWSE